MSVGSFSTILETFWFSSQRVGGQSGENKISGNKSSGPPQNVWSVKLSEMNPFHSMYNSLAITHTLQKKSSPPCRTPTDKCCASFTSHHPCLCICTVLHREQGKGPLHKWKCHTSTHGLVWSSWDFSRSQEQSIPFAWYLFLEPLLYPSVQ